MIDKLNAIIGGASGTDISGLDGQCVIDLTSCSYSIIEPSPVTKTVVSILIGGTSYPAPSNLGIRSVSAIKTWLDGLGKGTFFPTLNSDMSQLTILTSANPNAISTITFSLNSNNLVRSFNKNCGSLTAVLQAIIDYICETEYHTQDILLTSQITLCKRVAEEVTNQVFAVDSPLEAYLIALNTQLCIYANSPVKGDKGDDGVSVQVFVQPSQPTGGSYRNGDIWIVQ